MTACAVGGDVCVVEIGRYPGDGRVAVVAVVASADMRRVLAGRHDAVVAAAARADDLRVVDGKCRYPAGRAVAVLAKIRRLDVFGVLARRIEAVVAAGTAAGNPGVVEYDRDPGRAGVAVVALFARLRMPRWLAGGDDTVVTGATAAFGRGVVHVGDRAPGCRRVAVGAYVRGGDVVHRFCRRLNGTDRRVAADAGRVRSLEGTAGMAALAGNVGVRPVEDESRREVVERFLGAGCRRHRGKYQERCPQNP